MNSTDILSYYNEKGGICHETLEFGSILYVAGIHFVSR